MLFLQGAYVGAEGDRSIDFTEKDKQITITAIINSITYTLSLRTKTGYDWK